MSDEQDSDDEVGEAIFEGSWTDSYDSGPTQGSGQDRVADLGNGTWAVTSVVDGQHEREDIDAPANDQDLVDLLVPILGGYAVGTAIWLEPLDPDGYLTPNARGRLEDQLVDYCAEFQLISLYVSDSVLARIREELAQTHPYCDVMVALRDPAAPTSWDVLEPLLNGDINSHEELLDESSAAAYLKANELVDQNGTDGDKQLRTARETAEDPSATSAGLFNLLATHGPALWTAIKDNPSVTDTLLAEWALAGNYPVLAFVSYSGTAEAATVELAAERSSLRNARALLGHDGLGAATISGLSRNPNPAVRLLLAAPELWSQLNPEAEEDPDTPERATELSLLAAWRVLATDDDPSVRKAVGTAVLASMQGSEVHPEQLTAFPDADARRSLLELSEIPTATLMQLAVDESPDVRSAVARRADLEVDVLRVLTKDPDPNVRRTIVRHGRVSGELLEELASDTNAGVREQVAHRPATPASAIGRLAHDPDVWVRTAVAGRTKLPEQALASLIRDEDPRVRRCLASNASLETAALTELADDVDPSVRSVFAARADVDGTS